MRQGAQPVSKTGRWQLPLAFESPAFLSGRSATGMEGGLMEDEQMEGESPRRGVRLESESA